MTGILGGTFDPPHNGHVALAQAAVRELGLDRLVVLVAANPGHRRFEVPAEVRLQLARAAFPDYDVRRDEHAFTVDALRDGDFGDAVFVVGADEGRDFPTWKDPEGVLRHARLAIGTRYGYEQPDLSARFGDRVLFFELDSPNVSASEVRARIRRGDPIDDLVPEAVARLISELGLYREAGLHSAAP